MNEEYTKFSTALADSDLGRDQAISLLQVGI